MTAAREVEVINYSIVMNSYYQILEGGLGRDKMDIECYRGNLENLRGKRMAYGIRFYSFFQRMNRDSF